MIALQPNQKKMAKIVIETANWSFSKIFGNLNCFPYFFVYK